MFTTVHALSHWSMDNMISLKSQCWWGEMNKATENAYLTCPTYTKYNPGKHVHTAPGHFNWPNGQFKFWQMDSIQLPSSHEYKYDLVMVCVFSHWTEVFSWRQAMASSVAKVLWENFCLPGKLLSNCTWTAEPFYSLWTWTINHQFWDSHSLSFKCRLFVRSKWDLWHAVCSQMSHLSSFLSRF